VLRRTAGMRMDVQDDSRAGVASTTPRLIRQVGDPDHARV
jgi:hypothetical protein